MHYWPSVTRAYTTPSVCPILPIPTSGSLSNPAGQGCTLDAPYPHAAEDVLPVP